MSVDKQQEGRALFFENMLNAMDDEDKDDLLDELRSGKKNPERIKKRFDITDDEFFNYLIQKCCKPKQIAEDDKEKIRQLYMENNLDAVSIGKQLDYTEAVVQKELDAIRQTGTKPVKGSIHLQGASSESEHPQYLLPVDRVEIGLDANYNVVIPRVDARLRPLLKGNCTCAEKCRAVKNFIVIGQTGTGKSTLIDSYVNYLFGIDFYDKFRYKLIDERSIRDKNAANFCSGYGGGRDARISEKTANANTTSMTSSVTVYHLPAEWIKRQFDDGPCCINIIDSPGFGDTRKIDQSVKKDSTMDMFIYNMIEATLRQLESIDYILLVNKSSDTRLLDSSEFVFQSIQNLWARDIAERVLAMYTFSDGKKPNAEAAIAKAGIHINRGFKFNNSAIFESTDDTSTRFFFSLCSMNFKEFNTFISQSQKPPISLSLTQNVLDQRKVIEDTSFQAAKKSQALCKFLAEIQKQIMIAYTNSDQINQTKNFKTTYYEPGYEKLTYNGNVTQCKNCGEDRGICHKGCAFGNNDDKKRCCVMDQSTGRCKHCQCIWSDHINSNIWYKPCQKKIEKDIVSLKTQYGEAVKDLDNASILITSLLDDLMKTLEDFESCQKTLKRCSDYLEEHAYRKQAYYSTDFFKKQIKVIRDKGGADMDQQIGILQNMVDRQEAIRTVMVGHAKVERINDNSTDEVEVTIQRKMFEEIRQKFEAYKAEIRNKKKSNFQDDQDGGKTSLKKMSVTFYSIFSLGS